MKRKLLLGGLILALVGAVWYSRREVRRQDVLRAVEATLTSDSVNRPARAALKAHLDSEAARLRR